MSEVQESSTSSTAPKKATLFDRLGGTPAVQAAVKEFYDRMLADSKLAYFFSDSSMVHLKLHQMQFMKVAFTCIPEDFDVVAYLLDKHAALFRDKGLNETHFDLVAGHFVDTLVYLGIHTSLIEEAVGVIGPLRVVFEQGAKQAAESGSTTDKLVARENAVEVSAVTNQ
jgi:hemoglobin